MHRPSKLSRKTVDRMSAKERANQVRGRAGGVPLQTLSATERRQLTSGARIGGNRSVYQPHQGTKEMQRRRAKLEKASASGA